MNSLHLRAAGTSLVIDVSGTEAIISHWGADLGESIPDLGILSRAVSNSAADTPIVAGLLPQGASNWSGRPALRGSRVIDGVAGYDFSPELRLVSATQDESTATIVQADAEAGVEITSSIVLSPAGLVQISHTLRNTGETDYALQELAVMVPVPSRANELLDLSGRWCREEHPQRHDVNIGTWVRTGRTGRTDHNNTLLMAVGTSGFANRTGQVWAAHFGWSGDHEQFFEATLAPQSLLGAAEPLGAGEVVLAPGESYTTPVLFASYSDAGLDGVTARFHEWMRARDIHPKRPRPVTLNTWEAVYFDHRLEPLVEMADAAAAMGVERFVLDDGWFRARRNDRAGLGDWWVDPEVWPNGLTPLIDAVKSRGMEFGLWVEPEMVNLDSDLARNHPEWILRPTRAPHTEGGRLPKEWRHQHILDLTNDEAWQHIYDSLHAVLEAHDIAYMKWDHNRGLTEFGSNGIKAAHAQTVAVYRLFDALKAAHPGLEIESCASGGGRVDLGIMQHTDRVWASDSNDALDRQTIQRWTQSVLPPELVGSHVGPETAHTTGRTHDIVFRAITAMFGHFGMEWDIRHISDRDRAVLGRIIELYKQHRGLLHSGVRVNGDLHEDALKLHGVVAHDGSEALYQFVSLALPAAKTGGYVQFPGLDAAREYRVEVLAPVAADCEPDEHGHRYTPFMQVDSPAWIKSGGAVASGAFLGEVGLPMPGMRPAQALLIRVTAA